MGRMCRWLLFWTLLLLSGGWSIAAVAPAPDNDAFVNAKKQFDAGFYKRAEAEFAEFTQRYTNSPLLPEAILFQAQARIKSTNYAGALELLSANPSLATKRGDFYLLLTAEALSQKGDLQSAADNFGKVSREFPSSPFRLEAAVRETIDRSRLGDWPRVLQLLQDANAAFQSSVRAGATNEWMARGYLLLTEGHLRNNQYEPAGEALDRIQTLQLPLDLTWERQYFRCRILSLAGRTDEALRAMTNLLSLATSVGQPNVRAQSIALHAELLESASRPFDALGIYQLNLTCDSPPERQRQALEKINALSIKLNKLAESARILEQFLTNCPAAEPADLAIVTLGEFRLRLHDSGAAFVPVPPTTNGPAAASNYLQQALANFQTFTNRFPQSGFMGRAQFGLGWCYWLMEKYPESLNAFQAATQKLPPSPEQATALFKLGDAEFKTSKYNGALSDYQGVVERFGTFPEVSNTLFEPALYQTIRAGLMLTNDAAISKALSRILAWFPNGFHTDRAVLLAGQEMGQADPPAARQLFAEVEKNAPGSPLLPELQLAIARTFEQEGDWPQAIQRYNHWLNQYTNHDGQARAEYSRAFACSRANDTNAFNYFTNFIARFPTNDFAPEAQWWVAGYYYAQGNLTAAEQNYQFIYQNTNWAGSDLSYQARLSAGRAAFERQKWGDAFVYFKNLVENTNCPPELRAQGWCALGDTLISSATNKLAYNDALNAFDQILLCCPSNYMTALAWGKKASCLLLVAESGQDYLAVSNAFKQVLDAPQADAKARSIAKVGMGHTLRKLADTKSGLEKQHLLELALDQYLDVFYLKKEVLHDEKPDSEWTKRSGFAAAELAQSMHLYPQALNIYLRLKELFPPLRLETKIEALRAQTQQFGQRN